MRGGVQKTYILMGGWGIIWGGVDLKMGGGGGKTFQINFGATKDT